MSLFMSSFEAHQAGRLQEAADGYRRVLGQEPRHADALHLLGLIRGIEGDAAQSEALIREALSYHENAVFLCNLAKLLIDQARYDEAVAQAQRAIELNPGYFLSHDHLGRALMGLKRLPEAEAALRRALALDPHAVGALNNLGVVLADLGRRDEAEALYRRVLDADPRYVHAHYNLGLLQLRSGRFDEAVESLRRTLALDPAHLDAVNDLGTALDCSGHTQDAEAMYRDVIARDPAHAGAQWNLAIRLLRQGRYDEAWPHAEFRYRAPLRNEGTPPAYAEWQGEPLQGKSLSIWPEQGFGDYVQFARYVPLLKARGAARITLVCQPVLKPLLQTLDGVDEIVTEPSAVAPHDYWTRFMSLPYRCGTTVGTIPAHLPYLHALPERVARWRERVPARGLRVGLVWRGFAGHQHDDARSLPGLETLAPLWSVADVAFVSLQMDESAHDAMLAGTHQPLVRLGSQIVDFGDTAAIVASLDLVVTVDTAVAHVAGALGRPCWVLLSERWADWRWMEARDDTPWYPQALRLFRQTRHGDWRDVVERVAAALRERVAAQSRD